MARGIVWTAQAQEDYRQVVNYLLDAFGDEVAEKYTDRLSNVLNSIVAMPQMGRQHGYSSGNYEALHCCLLFNTARSDNGRQFAGFEK